jgi:hypothetical protein
MPFASDIPPLTPGRALAGLGLGAIWGASFVSLGVGAMLVGLQLASLEVSSTLSVVPLLVVMMLVAFVVAFVAWFAGLLIVGAPGWWVLHRLGLRSRWAYAALGLILAPAGYAAWSVLIGLPWISPIQTLKNGLVLDAALAAIGAVVGWVVAASAYRPEPRP